MTTTINNEHKKLNAPNKREQNQTCLDSAEREGLRPKGNVPNLRFPEFHGEWEKCRLGIIANVTGGYAFKSDTLNSIGGKYQVVKMGNLYQNQLDLHRSPSYTNILTSKAENVILRKGDIAITLTGTNNKRDFGYTYIFNDEKNLLLNQRCGLIRTKGDPYFLSCLLKTYAFLNQFFESATGGTGNQANVSTKAMEMFSVNTPSLKEQKKIGVLMALLDERIATQNKIIEDLKKLKSAIIENVFDDKHSERLQLDNVGSYIRGLTYSSNDVVEHGGTLVMRSNNIVNGSLLDYNNNVVFVNKQMSAEQQLQNGDIVICMANGSSSLVGKSSFYDGNWHSPITVGAFCGIYRSKEPIVKWLFQTNKYRRYIWNSLQGGNGAIANLNGEDILNMSFSIPNAPIKDTCVKMLTSVDSALENNISLCALYTLQKQYLLRQMFI